MVHNQLNQKLDSFNENMSVFSQDDLSSVKFFKSGLSYPQTLSNFTQNRLIYYEKYKEVCREFGVDHCAVTLQEFNTVYPLLCHKFEIDMNALSDKLEIEVVSTSNTPRTIYCTVIELRTLNYVISDGGFGLV